jgi:hypothetical protein
MALYVGLDVSLKTTSICIVEADGTLLWEGKAESEPVPLMNFRVGKRGLRLSALRPVHSLNGFTGHSSRAAFMRCASRHAMHSDSYPHAQTRQTVATREALPT